MSKTLTALILHYLLLIGLVWSDDEEYHSQILAGFDKDGDQQVSLQEFADNIGHPESAKTFQDLDKDGSGQLNAEELKGLYKTETREDDTDVATGIFEKADVDKDGRISSTEWVSTYSMSKESDPDLLKVFGKADKDGDGYASKKEMFAYLTDEHAFELGKSEL
mmetsp:Transcript_53077/g.99463  ORF Transcript_53077/g.99463 Transcript_53077/m.99463 type:complete len:164 (-) Transcript_53077:98-589(-)